MKVKDCMCGEVCCVKPETNISEIAKLMEKNHIGCVPVCDNKDCIVGVITDRDIILRSVACDKDLKTTKASISSKNSEINNSLKILAEQQAIIDKHSELLKGRMERLYKIYRKEYKFTQLATVKMNTITTDEFSKLTYEEAKSLWSEQVSRIANLESKLSSYETRAIISLFNIPTTTTTEVKLEDGSVEEKQVAIENPIATYFKDYVKDHEENYKLSDIKNDLIKFKYISDIFEMANYCTIERLYNNTTACVASKFLDKEIESRTLDNRIISDLELIKANLSSVKAMLSSFGYNCEGAVTFSINNDTYAIAKKFANTTAEEVKAYATIPMLRILNIGRNLIQSINGIEELNELQKLYVGDNELIDITSIDWSKMTDLRVLDLSYNDISEIKCLEVIATLERLDLSKNLISGKYNFQISGMPKLTYLNLSYNTIYDISLLYVQLYNVARDAGFKTIAAYLESGAFDVRFYGQILTMNIELVQMGTTQYVDLPGIFEQAETLDSARTSFGTNSVFGNVTNDGKQVILDTSTLGEKQAVVYITNTANKNCICTGTYCTINYVVKDPNEIEVPEEPTDPSGEE